MAKFTLPVDSIVKKGKPKLVTTISTDLYESKIAKNLKKSLD